jgi:drug/metabolite transporter (DMT)-like permease
VVAPASLIAPFTYSQIIRALLAGYFIFDDLPDLRMLLGCTVIVARASSSCTARAVLGRR